MLVLDTSLVVPQSLDCDSALPLTETRGRDRRIRKEDEHHYSPNGTESAALEIGSQQIVRPV